MNALYEGDRYRGVGHGAHRSKGRTTAFAPSRDALPRRARPAHADLHERAADLSKRRGPKPVMFFGARDDVYATQPGDGYAAMVGGVKLVSTDAQASLFGGKAVGHHSARAHRGVRRRHASRRRSASRSTFDGRRRHRARRLRQRLVKTSARGRARARGRLWGVRLDTAENMVDKSVFSQMGSFRPTGVNAQLVWNVRNALDAEGFGDVKIVVSGGFDVARIHAFEEDGVPVDAYGVGAALFDGRFDFTADIVQVNGKPQAKAGRELRDEPAARASEVDGRRLQGWTAPGTAQDEDAGRGAAASAAHSRARRACTRGGQERVSRRARFVQNIRRTLPTLAENLKSQFGMIADQVMAVNLAASRGASEAVRVRHAARRRGADQAGARDRDDADEGQAHSRGRRARTTEPRPGVTGDVSRCREQRLLVDGGSLDLTLLGR